MENAKFWIFVCRIHWMSFLVFYKILIVSHEIDAILFYF